LPVTERWCSELSVGSETPGRFRRNTKPWGSIYHVIDAKTGVGLSNDEHIVYDLSQATIAPLIELGRT